MTKKEKRKLEITLKAYDMLIETGVDNFSVNNLLEKISMSKGNFYHYFKNKDELFCESLKVAYQNISSKIQAEKQPENFEEKLYELYSIYLSKDEEAITYLSLVNQMYYMYSSDKNIYLYSYMQEMYSYIFYSLEQIMKNEIEKGNLKEDILQMIKPIAATADGMLTHSFMLKDYDLQKELKSYISFISKQYSLS